MFDILHREGIKAPPRDVYHALVQPDRLSGWMTKDTQGEAGIGGVARFRFGERGFDMKVLELEPEKRVAWEVTDGPAEWLGTRVSWDLAPEGTGTTLCFRHQGWREQGDFMAYCSTQWATFLMSLKSLVETGKGAPFPDGGLIRIEWT